MAETNDPQSSPPPPSVQRVALAECVRDPGSVIRVAENGGRVVIVDSAGAPKIFVSFDPEREPFNK